MMNYKPCNVIRITVASFGILMMSISSSVSAHGAPKADNIPTGVVKAVVTYQPKISGLNAIILDAPRPGIMLRYSGEETLTILGSDGSDLMRFTGTQVYANTQNPDWKKLPNLPKGLVVDPKGWVKLSSSGSYGWLDPRLDALHDANDENVEPINWSIAVKRADKPLDNITGQLYYKKL